MLRPQVISKKTISTVLAGESSHELELSSRCLDGARRVELTGGVHEIIV